MPQLVWIARPDGVVTYYNDRVEEFAGAMKKDDGSWEWQGLLHPEDREITEVSWSRAVKEGSVYQIEHRVKLRNGEYRWFLSRGLPQYDDKGRIRKWFGTATDIHESKLMSELLEAKVVERTREYELVNRALRQSNEELLRFAHIASHDLKEPLRKIRLFGNMFLESYGNLVPDQGRTLLNKVIRSSDRLNNLVDGILNYSTVDMRGRDIETCDLDALVSEVLVDLELIIEDKNASIVKERLPRIPGHRIYLQQLFYNLLSNSLKFSSTQKSPSIRIYADQPGGPDAALLAEAHLEGSYCKIVIEDNGIGFEPAYAEKIFGVLERLHSREAYEGTGLGLALCRKIVEKHEGCIYAVSEAGEGSRFVILLPNAVMPRQNRS